jgi:hypothetical protein
MRQTRKAELALLGMALVLGLTAAGPVFAWTTQSLNTTIQCYNTGTGTWSTCPGGTLPAGTTIRDSATITMTKESNCGTNSPNYPNCGTISFYIVSGSPSESYCSSGDKTTPPGATAEGVDVVPSTAASSGSAGPLYSLTPTLASGTYYFYVHYSGTGTNGYPSYSTCEPFTGGSFSPPPTTGVPQFPFGMAALMLLAIPALLLVKGRFASAPSKV